MPPESGGIGEVLTQDFPLGYLQGGQQLRLELIFPFIYFIKKRVLFYDSPTELLSRCRPISRRVSGENDTTGDVVDCAADDPVGEEEKTFGMGTAKKRMALRRAKFPLIAEKSCRSSRPSAPGEEGQAGRELGASSRLDAKEPRLVERE